MKILGITGIVLALVLSSRPLFSQSNSTYDFLRNDVSARAAALAGSFVSIADDPNTIFYNPAGLGTMTQTRASVGFFKHLLDINSGYASIATQIPNFGNIGAGIVYINYGEFKQTGDEGQDLGTFGAGELALSLGYGGTLQEGLNYGANMKFIYSQIADARSSALAVDLGVQYIAVANRLTLGASVLNLGTQLSPYVNTRENLPLDLNIGFALYPEHLPAAVLFGFHKLSDQYDNLGDRLRNFTIGVEFTPGPNVHLRMGYDNARRQDLIILSSAGLAGISIGGGVSTDLYSVDYTFSSLGQIGSIHRVSISF
jgi:hypothetical protein